MQKNHLNYNIFDEKKNNYQVKIHNLLGIKFTFKNLRLLDEIKWYIIKLPMSQSK